MSWSIDGRGLVVVEAWETYFRSGFRFHLVQHSWVWLIHFSVVWSAAGCVVAHESGPVGFFSQPFTGSVRVETAPDRRGRLLFFVALMERACGSICFPFE